MENSTTSNTNSIRDFKNFFLEEYDNQEEKENAKNSSLRGMNIGQHRMHVTVHAGSQSHLRRPDMNADHWNDIIGKVHKAVSTKPGGHYLVYSKQHEQGLVVQHLPHAKKINVMTVLPRGKSNVKPGTEKMMVEGFEIVCDNIILI